MDTALVAQSVCLWASCRTNFGGAIWAGVILLVSLSRSLVLCFFGTKPSNFDRLGEEMLHSSSCTKHQSYLNISKKHIHTHLASSKNPFAHPCTSVWAVPWLLMIQSSKSRKVFRTTNLGHACSIRSLMLSDLEVTNLGATSSCTPGAPEPPLARRYAVFCNG